MRSRKLPTDSRPGAGHPLAALSVLALVAILSIPFRGCQPEDMTWAIDCMDCYTEAPDSAKLIVYLTINEENQAVPLTFYRGTVEDGAIDWIDTAVSGEFTLYSAIDQTYSVMATYRSGDKTILAFDEDRMRVVDEGESCGTPCYMVRDGIFDVRLPEP
ncbi:MAG: hypothetical protein R2751_05910 [Bacteroidales bacterium]